MFYGIPSLLWNADICVLKNPSDSIPCLRLCVMFYLVKGLINGWFTVSMLGRFSYVSV